MFQQRIESKRNQISFIENTIINTLLCAGCLALALVICWGVSA